MPDFSAAVSKDTRPLAKDAPVFHARHGTGRVVADLGPTVVVRFEHGLEQLPAEDLSARISPAAALEAKEVGEPLDALVKAQALAIRSANDQWGVFSRSRIALLPHQLWVCHRVTQTWPFRWLIADDVGLGKTIEAGLAMMPLIASGTVRRLLVLAPAKLVPQWQKRLKDMFDIRLQLYTVEADSAGNFWDAAPMVVGSLHTLRARREGLLAAEPWDLVVVDEAHHLNIEENGGATLAYDLLAEMQERGRMRSLLFFTGTPHRGKDHAFFGLLSLLRPDIFDAKKEAVEQYDRLPEVMIRNNKANVTDLEGRPLFKPVTVLNREYSYSKAEETFYRTVSEFILAGRAYADTFDARGANARMLLLITLQKLAASSIAAISGALRRRRKAIESLVAEPLNAAHSVQVEPETLDEAAEADEALPESVTVLLMRDEIERIDELLTLADAVEQETKIGRLLDLIAEELPSEEPILLFTEYKATQALVINAIHRRFGHGCAAFINGDERVDGLIGPDGRRRPVVMSRDDAASDFNEGRARFLVSTEAGGEGIDLQERCATLVHVDMPWNPMRLHQRVGRLSRYGQTRAVTVYILRNPATVEARIWSLLNDKLERIQRALSAVMPDQEDISQLVIGIAGDKVFTELFANAPNAASGLEAWFEAKSARLNGRDLVETVRSMFGNVARFDFGKAGHELPKLDLADLEAFFVNALQRHGRRVFRGSDGLEVLTPVAWAEKDWALSERYRNLVLDRNLRSRDATTRVLGVGHRLFDVALSEGFDLPVSLASLQGLENVLLVALVEDEVTGSGATARRLAFGIIDRPNVPAVLRDWELLALLNKCRPRGGSAPYEPIESSRVARLLDALNKNISQHAPMMKHPKAWPAVLLAPAVTSA
jgi:ERCC4-related helicase